MCACDPRWGLAEGPGPHQGGVQATLTLEGLRLLHRAHALPRPILVETNVLHRSKDRAFSANLVAPVTLETKRFIPILRNTHRPIPELSWGADQLLRKIAGRSDRASAPEGSTVTVNETAGLQGHRLKSKLYHEMLTREVEERAALPTATETAETTAALIDLAGKLRERGATIVFFETPVDPTISSSPAYAHNRGIIDQCFPRSEFPRLPIPDGREYETTDGVHPDSASAQKFAAVIRQQIKERGLGQ
ncbi:MAG: hypothetical protein ACJAQ3_002095 [Planctomycetota bacterium]|jgi:hypothetical protein